MSICFEIHLFFYAGDHLWTRKLYNEKKEKGSYIMWKLIKGNFLAMVWEACREALLPISPRKSQLPLGGMGVQFQLLDHPAGRRRLPLSTSPHNSANEKPPYVRLPV